MTTSNWDNFELHRLYPECKTLKDIIARLEKEFSGRGEVICEIQVNGKVLSEDDEMKLAESPSSEIRDLSVRTNRPGQLISDALNSALAFIPDLEASALRTSEEFRGGLNTAQKSFSETLEGCQWIVDTLMHVRGAASGIGAPIAHAERWFDAERLITDVIRNLSEAYNNADLVLVADLLEYELTGALSVWKEALENERGSRTAP